MNLRPSELFDEQAIKYLEFTKNSFSWEYIEKPGFDAHIPDIYRNNIKVLDTGCGGGRVIRHLIKQGILPENITGIDIGQNMLDHACKELPGVKFVKGNSISLPFTEELFDLVVSNMVLHQMNDKDLIASFREIHRVLSKMGTLFFVDTNPYSSPERRAKLNKWTKQSTPWGTEIPAFIHDLRGNTLNSILSFGFRLVELVELPVASEGQSVDPEEYQRYTRKPFRIAGKFIKE